MEDKKRNSTIEDRLKAGGTVVSVDSDRIVLHVPVDCTSIGGKLIADVATLMSHFGEYILSRIEEGSLPDISDLLPKKPIVS